MASTLHERLERNVIRDGNTSCWLWVGTANKAGYGAMHVGGKSRLATHLSLAVAGRPVPRGLLACHHCDTPACINPNHLFIGTIADNNADMVAKGRNGGGAPHGERHGSAKLTEDLVVEIRRLAGDGVAHTELARRYHVHGVTIGKIVHRKKWVHVP